LPIKLITIVSMKLITERRVGTIDQFPQP